MPCVTCGHTLQTVMVDRVRTLRHCPRCGTMVSEMLGHGDVTVPKLVERHREFIRMTDDTAAGRWLREQCHIVGVTESVLPPEQRPPAE
jgi:uncharacterized Zn finger protein